MKHITGIILCMILGYYCNAQDLTTGSKIEKIKYNGFVGIGRGTFETNLLAPSKFPTLELRLGMGLRKPIGGFFELRSRLTIGLKVKREAIDKNPQFRTIESLFHDLDDVSSNRNRAFIEIPLLLQFNFPGAPVGLRAGVNYRSFFSDNAQTDFLTAQREFGVITGAYYRVTDKMNVGFDYYFGLTRIFRGQSYINSTPYSLDIRTQFAQLTFEIDL